MSFFEKIKSRVLKALNLSPATPKTISNPEDPNSGHQSDGANWRAYLDEQLQRNADDKIKYADYDLMDSEIPEISAALDVTADFVVYPDNVGKSKTFKVRSKQSNIQTKIDEIDKITRFQTEFHSLIRETCKYGDNFEELLRGEKTNTILGFKNIPIESVVVNMNNGILGTDPMLTQLGIDYKPVAKLKDTECLHFSLATERKRYTRYGKGVSRIEKSRLIYRQLRLMEEGMMISRLSRSNQNFAIIVDVGDLYGEEVFDYLDKYKKRINRRRYIDPTTGHISYKFNPLSVFEDLLIPTRQGSGSNVVSLNSGATATKGIEDIHYFQNKLIYANGVPKLLIGKEEDVNSKATSDVQYISFLRNIRRIQTLVESEIIRFYQTALATMGVENADLYVEWPVIGTIDEERKWRIELMKMQVAQMMGKDLSLVDDMYIYMNLMGMSEKEANELITRMDKEEEEAAAEFDVQVDDAEDQTEDPYEDKPELAPGEKPKPAAKKAPAKKPSKEQEYYDKLGPARYEVFTRMRKAMEKNAEFKKVVLEFVQLTQAKLGE